MSEAAPQPLVGGIAGLGALANFENLDLSSVSTDYPVLEAGLYLWLINKAYYTKSKDQKSEMLRLELATVNAARDKTGKEVPAGYKLTHNIGLTPSFEKFPGTEDDDHSKPLRTPEMIMRDVASLLDAVFGEPSRKRIVLAEFDVASLVNQRIMARTTVAEEKNGFPESTRITRFIKSAAGSSAASGQSTASLGAL